MCVYWVAHLGRHGGRSEHLYAQKYSIFCTYSLKKKGGISMKPFPWRKQTFRFCYRWQAAVCTSCSLYGRISAPFTWSSAKTALALLDHFPTFLYDCMTELFFLRSEPPFMPPTDRVEILNGGKLLNVPQAMERTMSLQDEALQCKTTRYVSTACYQKPD